MILYPNAKINIGLSIIEKRPDGFHELESIMMPISLFDILEITKSTDFEFIQTGLAVEGNSENNLCVKAFRLMERNFTIGQVRIHLRKQIPMGAGLGGGSADATFVLKGINELFQLNLSIRELQELAVELGSDCAFFVANVSQLAKGRGEILENFPLELKGKYIKIINPGIHISTKEAFSNVVMSGKRNALLTVSESTISSWKNFVFNDFETHLFSNFPELLEIKNQLYKEGAVYASMSGSGSTLFGIFETEPQLSEMDYPLEKVIKL